jgi:pilus assembly protein CpaB
MNSRLVLVVALLLAGATAWFVQSWLSSQQTAVVTQQAVPAAAPSTVEILVTNRELAVGTFIKPEHLLWKAWPQDSVVPGYLARGTTSETDLVGAVVRTPMYAGEPLTKERVVHPGDQSFLAAVLQPGKRAVSVPVDATRGVSGFVFPGDRVDVLLTFRRDVVSSDGETAMNETRYFSQTLLTDVRVLGIDQAVRNEGNQAKVARTATLEVTPKQAEKIAVALELGELSLSLRSIGREEIEMAQLTRAVREAEAHAALLSAANGSQTPPVRRGSYTTGTEILSMVGDPEGLPAPGGRAGARINLLRGSEAGIVKY